jgi:uncharacterized membrane protein AbrB (regulator of aidB expression)
MKRLILLILLVPLVFAQEVEHYNETSNETIIANETRPWYEEYTGDLLEGSNLTLITVIIGLILVYLLGKIAFKLIKWAIIILAIILALKIILF